MGLEATMLLLDNSEFARNGDFTPSRFMAQKDAAQVLFSAKRQSNPESAVGLGTLAGNSPQVMVTLTQENGKISSALHRMDLGSNIQFATGISIAALALKHRLNKNQHQRIIAFVASPLIEREEELVKLGKKLKKNGVAVDVVNFGQVDDNLSKLEAFIGAVNSNENSHLVNVGECSGLLSDALLGSALFGEEGAGISSSDQFEFGIDPNLDPELALALRLSLEEEQNRQQQQQQQSSSTGSNNAAQSAVSTSNVADAMQQDDDEEAMLAQAIAMSMQQQHQESKEDTEMTDADKNN